MESHYQTCVRSGNEVVTSVWTALPYIISNASPREVNRLDGTYMEKLSELCDSSKLQFQSLEEAGVKKRTIKQSDYRP